MNNLDKIYSCEETVEGFSKAYLKYISDVLSRISVKEIAGFIEVLIQARERGASIYFIGNGGSAATASHFANDLAIGTRSWDKPFRVISLCDNQAVITAIGNDSGYEKIFYEQLSVLLKKEDVVVAISASGNSPNLIEAVNKAKEIGAKTIALTAFDGGILRTIVDAGVHVPTDKAEYGPAEDAHMVLDHLVGSYLIRMVRSENQSKTGTL